MVGGWSTRKDGMGSALSGIRAVEGSGDGATRISIELFPGGWAGIAKEFSPTAGGGGLNLAGTDGAWAIRRPSRSGWWTEMGPNIAAPGRMELGSTGWCRQEARCQDIGGVGKEGSGDLPFEVGNVTRLRVVASGGGKNGASSGWIVIEDLEAFRRRDG
ncbi:MAG: hypothetical protein PHN90_05405 [Methanothrix sp.]|jgi:hypothetical protein|nr:hypothetical protein [Methanothrix sp.]NLX38058.1 hypothetical protein [Methanothrix sp.]HNR57988.1 hypothetical protein [Methanothrix sp.]HNT71581.1 hypothetical protein [Methanothrix sp.]HQA63322.1 hypothetical protein [Methanothrix sp.]